jgi:DNA-binding MarR family transcriptional regulator
MPRSSPKRTQPATAPIDLDRTLEFMRVLWELDHGLQKTSKRMGATLGVTGPQRLVLRLVGRAPGISPTALARTLHVDPSTVTVVVARLVESGALVRRADPADARRVRLELTARGRRLDAVRTGTVEAVVRGVLAKASARDVAAARRVLGALADALEGRGDG